MELLWIAWIVVTLPSVAMETCPGSCYCDEQGEYVSCVGDGVWDSLPDIPRTTQRLELRNYFFEILSSRYLEGLVQLRELKLQQTHTKEIENGTFANLQKLEHLDLSQNSIHELTDSIFSGLEELRVLEMSANFLVSIDEAFIQLKNLEQLNLRDNRIVSLTTQTFSGLQKIQYLNLDSNAITSIEVGTFQYLTTLAHLIISNNPLTSLARLDFFGSRLQFIDMSLLGLSRVPQSLTKFVRDLRLAKNNLTKISAGDFDSYPYLGLLVMDDNCISDIENDALGRQEYLLRLWLNGNCLTRVPHNLPPSLQALYLEENKLTILRGYSFKGLIHLEQLFLQRNQIREISPCAFCDLINLKTLHLQANRVTQLFAGSLSNLSKLEMLDLSQNILKVFDSKSFYGLSKLKTLQISRISTSVKVEESAFDPLENLQTLEAYDSDKLVHQVLNSTRILHSLRKVQELNIMRNQIEKMRSDFPSFFPSMKVIKMSGNLWHCDREILWLVSWIKVPTVHFYNSHNIRCATPRWLQFKPIMMLTERDLESPSKTMAPPILSNPLETTTPYSTSTYRTTTIISSTTQRASTKSPETTTERTTLPSYQTSEYSVLRTKSALGVKEVNSKQPDQVETTPQKRIFSKPSDDGSVVNSEPKEWGATTTVILSTTLAGAVVLIMAGVFTLVSVCRCRYRYRPMKQRQIRRSDSISYFPQQDEVSIVALTEGSVEVRTNSHHGLGNKLYYAMESSEGGQKTTKETDPQLQELLSQEVNDNCP